MKEYSLPGRRDPRATILYHTVDDPPSDSRPLQSETLRLRERVRSLEAENKQLLNALAKAVSCLKLRLDRLEHHGLANSDDRVLVAELERLASEDKQ